MRDPVTGQLVNLEVFGPTNASVFAHLLTATSPGANDQEKQR
jgi:hypothetical protein